MPVIAALFTDARESRESEPFIYCATPMFSHLVARRVSHPGTPDAHDWNSGQNRGPPWEHSRLTVLNSSAGANSIQAATDKRNTRCCDGTRFGQIRRIT